MTSWGVNRLDVFIIGGDSAIYHRAQNGSTWDDWEHLGGTFISEPVSVTWGPKRLDIGVDSGLYHKWWNDGSWSPSKLDWENLGRKWVEKPSVMSWGPNHLDVFVIGQDRGLYRKFWNGSSWSSKFVSLGPGKHLSSPSVLSWMTNTIGIFTTGTDSIIYHKWWHSSVWGPNGEAGSYASLGDTCTGRPKAVSWSSKRIDLFYIGRDSALYHKWMDGTN